MIGKKPLYPLCIVLMYLNAASLHAEYVEGIDTTTADGYGRKAAFRVYGGYIRGKVIAHYFFDRHWCRGYYNYSFEEIMTAPDTIRYEYEIFNPANQPFYCFIVKDTIRNTYTKVKILKQLDDNRYVYRFGTNTTANDRLLTGKTTVPPSSPYKVNNLYFTGIPYFMHKDDPEHLKYYSRTLSWDPPLENSYYKPVRYIFCKSKDNVTIDTTVPIKPAQWDSMEIGSSPEVIDDFPMNGYFNFIVAYNNGMRSEFLSGWSACGYDIVNIRQSNPSPRSSSNEIIIGKRNDWLFIDLSRAADNSGIASIELFTLAGKRAACIPSTKNTIFLNTSQPEIKTGSYILKTILKGGKSITSPLTLVR